MTVCPKIYPQTQINNVDMSFHHDNEYGHKFALSL